MSKRDKLRRKLRNNPKGVQFNELETLLVRFGFSLVRTNGSHHFFQLKTAESESIFVVPMHRNHVKAAYVKAAIELLDDLFPEVESTDATEEDDEDE
jgi:predicted RNA binding protein YcfA (HicA-like mRNA interferase family)